ncbi:hypothetical protein DFH06DRAFT_1025326 [Mycena polygramma]|nr:hypothetical protein DFH06DRAFT_1025326 [Mycena polygramma]
MWEAQDADAWPQELRSATRAFARGMALGGEEWELCVSRLLALEKAQGFPEKGLLSAPKGGSEERPKEIPLFMKGRRRWEDQVELTSSVGPRDLVGSFSDRWWSWWGKIQPESRRMENGDLRGAEKVAAGGWTELSKMGGRNGLSLYVGSLLWWGEAAGEADDAGMLLADWRLALNEVASVLAVVPMWVPRYDRLPGFF